MSAQTSIEWTDATWNPVTGCTEVSPGCDHCYAKTFAERWRDTPGHYFENGFDVRLREDKLGLPLTWKKPRKVFVNSMSDLFHNDVPISYIARVFAVMALAKQHTFQILTKRHGRMRAILAGAATNGFHDAMRAEAAKLSKIGGIVQWPLPNVWLGVSVENQQWAEIRIPHLLATPAAVRWLSCEPLLGPADLSRWLGLEYYDSFGWGEEMFASLAGKVGTTSGLHWVVAGGESGVGHRPLDLDWIRTLRDQCVAAKMPFLFKQVGGRTSKSGGRELDGRTWDQYPERAA